MYKNGNRSIVQNTIAMILGIVLFCMSASNAWAQCSTPTASLGAMEYFTGTNEYKFCNGTSWIAFSSVTDLSACADTAKWQWDAAEAAYKYCNGSIEKEPGCLWNAAGGGEAVCPEGGTGSYSNYYLRVEPPTIVDYIYFATSIDISGTTAVAASSELNNINAIVIDTTDGSTITTINNVHASDLFGTRSNMAAIDGSLVVLGSYDNDVDATNAGRAYIFDATDGSLLFTLTKPTTPATYDFFGYSVAIDGTTVVVGMPGYFLNSDIPGTAYVFDATDGSLITTLNNPNPNADDEFGNSVAISGNTVVVGAPSDSPSGVSGAGQAYVFNATTGALLQTLVNPDLTSADSFGTDVAVDGTVAVVSAPSDDPGGVNNGGTVYVFDVTDGSLTTTINEPTIDSSDLFGFNVTVSGTNILVGDGNENGSLGDYEGIAYMFDATDGSLINTWYSPDPQIQGYYGRNVAMDGNVFLVQEWKKDIDGSSNVGRLYIYDKLCSCQVDATGDGPPEDGQALNNPSPNSSDVFGETVAISGTTAVVGAWRDESDGGTGVADAGRAYVFDVNSPATPIATLNNPSPNTNDYFGYSVAISGTTAVVGAYADESDGGTGVSGAGRAYVFDATDGTLIATLNNPSPNTDDHFGRSIAISGTTAVVGAIQDESDGGTGVSGAGRAYVFDINSPATPIATLNNPSPNTNDYFGNSVAISGTTAVIGAYWDESDGGTGVSAAGRAYVFDATDGTLITTLNNPSPNTSDEFGWSVAISGTTAIVGAFRDESDGGTGVSAAGRAYVFDATDGTLIATLNNPSPNLGDNFGNSVAIIGTTAIVGAPYDESDGGTGVSDAGRAYVFELPTYGDFSGILTETAINHPDPAADDGFSWDVDVSGTTAVIGTPLKDVSYKGSNADAGSAYLIDTTDGSLLYTLTKPTPIAASDNFGRGVGISGNIVVVGAEGDDPGGVSGAGALYVFDATDGSLTNTISHPSPTAGDKLGYSADVSGTLAIAGAWGANPGGVSDAGEAYIFDVTDGSLVSTLINPDPTISDRFGWSVAISGTTAVVGAYRDDPGGFTDAGTAYVFNATDGSLITTLNNPSPTDNDWFGESVAISGTTAVVGAAFDDPGGFSAAGTVYVFDATDGTLTNTLNYSSPSIGDQFGHSVGISGNTAVVGAYGQTPSSVYNGGEAYIYDTTDGSLLATLSNPNPTYDDQYGSAVAISGSTAVVGTLYDESDGGAGTTDTGRAYAYSTGECIPQEKTGGGSSACYNEGSCSTTGAINVINSKLVVCNGSVWETFAQ